MKKEDGHIDFSMVLASSVHDMKNSVGMLLASLEQLMAQTPVHETGVARHFNTLHYEASRINSELVQLLTIYRMQNDFLPVRIDENYVIDVLEEQIARNQMLFETANIALTLECDPALTWYYDEDLVANVIHNVLINCARYTKSALKVIAREEGSYLCLTIADNGSGYPPHMLKKNALQPPDLEGGNHTQYRPPWTST